MGLQARHGASLVALVLMVMIVGCEERGTAQREPVNVRVATYNIEDIRSTDLTHAEHPRLKVAARTIQQLRPDILLVNEMTFDMAGVPGYSESEGEGSNPRRFVDRYLSVTQAPDLRPILYQSFTAPSNTGLPSGFDLDNNGSAVGEYPEPASAGPDGAPLRQTAQQRSYGGDTWGFGTYPGQYGMALFVSEDLVILRDSIRTFHRFLWKDMPGALRPRDPVSGDYWYSDEEWAEMRLSSKSHWDVPIRLPNGRVLHLLASHPTPPAFDGSEMRNKLRNHDEIRFWIDYVNGADYMIDDKGRRGGLSTNEPFVIVGDLNADPDEGNAYDNPAGKLLGDARVNSSFVPEASKEGQAAYPELDADDTAEWGLRIDYVLPSSDLEISGGGVLRPVDSSHRASDHFPVWLDLIVPSES